MKMSELVFEDVSMEINSVKVAENLAFHASGLCCVSASPNSENFKELLLLFSKTHLNSANDIRVRGKIYFDGKALPAVQFHHLLNQHFVFEGNESVIGVLTLINSEEAAAIAKKFEIHFTSKRTDHLSVQESRIFEMAVNLAAKPPVMYFRLAGLTVKQKEMCLTILSEFAKSSETVIFIESDEFLRQFDCALVLQGDEILSLDRKEAELLFTRRKLGIFNLPAPGARAYPAGTVIESEVSKPPTDMLYDHKKLFKAYKTENIVDLKHKKMSVAGRLATIDFYKVNLSQALVLGYKKYEMTFQKHEKRKGIIKSLYPSFMLIIILRVMSGATAVEARDNIIRALAFLPDAFMNGETAPILAFLITDAYLGDTGGTFAFIKKFFRQKFTEMEQRLIFGSVSFSIMYQYSSIFEEDCQALNYNINVLMTPGTYITSVFIFTALAHITTFATLGWIFNLKYMIVNLISAFFINLISFGFFGKRLKTTFIGFFISTCIFGAIVSSRQSHSKSLLAGIHLMFPLFTEGTESLPFFGKYSNVCLVLYCMIIYVITCHRLSLY